MQWDLRRPERWRGRVRGQVTAWSVLPVAAVVIVVGGLFWASVWMVLRTPTHRGASASTELIDTATPVADERAETGAAVADDDEMILPDEPADVVYAGPAYESDQPMLASVDETAASTNEPDELAGPVEEPGSPEAVAPAETTETQAAETGGQATDRAAELTAKAEELTAKADELTARAEELTGRLEGLATKIDELTARLEATRANVAVQPAVVPSPVPAPRPPEAVAARAGQAGANDRAPWVVLPQPEPGSRVTAGPLVLETRARGAAPITEIRLQLDGVALSVALDRRDDTTWRGRATTKVGPGSHSVAVAVVDGQGRIGTYRWQFDAAAS